MTADRVAAAYAELDRRETLAKAAHPGKREVRIDNEYGYMVGTAEYSICGVAFEDAPDARHIAAWDPELTLGVIAWARGVLGRHAVPVGAAYCRHDGRLLWPCPDVRAVLDVFAPLDGAT